MQIVTECQLTFGFRLPNAIIANTVKTFCRKYDLCVNQLHKLSQLPLYRRISLCQLLFVSYCSFLFHLFIVYYVIIGLFLCTISVNKEQKTYPE